jgi:hypothetical protein
MLTPCSSLRFARTGDLALSECLLPTSPKKHLVAPNAGQSGWGRLQKASGGERNTVVKI